MNAERPRAASAWIGYTALRLLLFAVPFLVIWGFSDNPSLSAVLAAVIGLALSVVLLDRRRSAVGGLIAERMRRHEPSSDESVEDRAIDGGSTPTTPSPAPSLPASSAPSSSEATDGQIDSAAARPSP